MAILAVSWPTQAGQLEQVVSDADQGPFALHLLRIPQLELPEPLSLLDLAEDRPHRRYTQGVTPPASLVLQLAVYLVSRREILGDASFGAAGGWWP